MLSDKLLGQGRGVAWRDVVWHLSSRPDSISGCLRGAPRTVSFISSACSVSTNLLLGPRPGEPAAAASDRLGGPWVEAQGGSRRRRRSCLAPQAPPLAALRQTRGGAGAKGAKSPCASVGASSSCPTAQTGRLSPGRHGPYTHSAPDWAPILFPSATSHSAGPQEENTGWT